MGNLRVDVWKMQGGKLGQENPLPTMYILEFAQAGEGLRQSVPEEDRAYMGWGVSDGFMTHRGQYEYDRSGHELTFKSVVLQNDILRATFLPTLGGRLWSLFHKPSETELLEVNPHFTPVNIAVRGAWFSGGIEWNHCVYGHSPYTCSPVFATRLSDSQRGDVLRLYEWERTRCVPVQLDFYLPEGSHFLFLKVRILNPNENEIPIYWWTNMSVVETSKKRILGPADHAFTYEYGGATSLVPFPEFEGTDVSYPAGIPSSRDFFLRIPERQRPWIAALDEDGCGLIHASSSRLKGRKFFAWGTNTCGRNWAYWCSAPNAKFEIQAGLCRTQMESAPMPAGAQWTWLEAFGRAEVDPQVVHGSNWQKAWRHVDSYLDEVLPQNCLETEVKDSDTFLDSRPEEIILRASGWGRLEQLRREKAGENPMCGGSMVFDDQSLGPDQQPWLTLLMEGYMSPRDPSEAPGAFVVQSQWRKLLEQVINDKRSDHWLSWFHLGLMYFNDGDVEGAKRAWRTSLERDANPWTYRNLAQLAKHEGKSSKAVNLYLKAREMAPALLPLIIETCDVLIEMGKADKSLEIIERLPSGLRLNTRIQLLEACSAIKLGQLDRAESILNENFELVDNREGDEIMTDAWFELQARRIAEAEGTPIDDELRQRVRQERNPPKNLEQRNWPGI